MEKFVWLFVCGASEGERESEYLKGITALELSHIPDELNPRPMRCNKFSINYIQYVISAPQAAFN